MSKMRVTLKCECNKFLDHKTPCCEFFKRMLNDCKVRLTYSEKHNLYGIQIISSNGVQGIRFCPWCGIKFPEWKYQED